MSCSSSHGELQSQVWLAAPDETNSVSSVELSRLNTDPFTIKLGGTSAWLYGNAEPVPPLPRCQTCGAALVLVVQAHAPLLDLERILYVFACLGEGCQQSWMAVRCQVPCAQSSTAATAQDSQSSASTKGGSSADQVVKGSFDVDDDWDADPSNAMAAMNLDDEKSSSTSAISTNQTSLSFSTPLPKSTLTVSNPPPPKHVAPTATLAPFYAPPILLDVFPEPEEFTDSYQNPKGAPQSWESYGQDADDGGSVADEPYERQPLSGKTFRRFQKRVHNRCPTQCLRWGFPLTPLALHDNGPPPLAKTYGSNQTLTALPPKCSRCGAPRTCELQLLPTVLYFLGGRCQLQGPKPGVQKKTGSSKTTQDAAKKQGKKISFESQQLPGSEAPSLSFGTITVYTCSAHCGTGEYVFEHVHWQSEL